MRGPPVWPPVAVKPMSVRVRSYALRADWLQQQFEQPNHWTLDSSSYGAYGLDSAVARHHSSAIAQYCNTTQLRMRRIEALCRRSVAVARHLRRTALRHFNTIVSLLYDALALHLYAITMPRRYAASVLHHYDVAILQQWNIAQLQRCDAVAFRRLSVVILWHFDILMPRVLDALMF